MNTHGSSTQAVRAGIPVDASPGEPFLPGPALAAPYRLHGPEEPLPRFYTRASNPTWELLEAAIAALEGGGDTVVFSSGMAALSAVVEPLKSGDVLVACEDGYPGIRQLAAERLAPRGVEVRLVPTRLEAVVAALPGATLVWVESPTNPGLDVVDLRVLAAAAQQAGAALAVDNTLATPLGQRPLDLGAHFSMLSATKALGGHSDLMMGAVTVRDDASLERLRSERWRTGAIAGPFEAWLLHRSLATLDLRLVRQEQNALALAELLLGRPDVRGVRYPGLASDPAHAVAASQMRRFGSVLGFELEDEHRAREFLQRCDLVIEATSFGGVHSTAERRARWKTDNVTPGFIRFSAGIEDAEDLVTAVTAALAAMR